MMPIFFNLESHLWIFYLLVLNGLLVHLLLRAYATNYRNLTQEIEAQLLAAFFISVLLNGLVLLICSQLGLAFSKLGWFYLGLTTVLSLGVLLSPAKIVDIFTPATVVNYARIVIYLLVFFVLFYNGALIEQIADSWWHLALAQKIAHSGSLEQTVGQLNSAAYRYYPPLWHGNLALVSEISGERLPVLWNSVTAWVGIFKVMAFYLLALSLSKDRWTAVAAAALFVLLRGLGDSYMRVSGWPSHVSYAALFTAVFTAFYLFDRAFENADHSVKGMGALLRRNASGVCALLMLICIMYFTHKVEVLWFAAIFLAYAFALFVYRIVGVDSAAQIEAPIIRGMFSLALGTLCIFSLWFLVGKLSLIEVFSDKFLAYLAPILWVGSAGLAVFLSGRSTKLRRISWILLVLSSAMMLISINYTHLLSLFLPDYALPRRAWHELPSIAQGFLGGELKLPGWHLQLREGLLYAGVLSIPVSWAMAYLKPSRLSLFLAGTGTVAGLFLVSPYLYTWLSDIMRYHSSWRIGIMVFHPLVFAYLLVMLVRLLAEKRNGGHAYSPAHAILGLLLLISLVAVIVRDSAQHFDKDLIQLKRNHQSPQRNWNAFYGQRFVWADSSLRYSADMEQLESLIEPYSVVFSDLPTSYYLAAEMPVYVRNLQRHQGARRMANWRTFIQSNNFCYLDKPQQFAATAEFLSRLKAGNGVKKAKRLDYIVINKDEGNRALRYGCMWNRRGPILNNIERLAELEYEGEYLNLYSLKD